MQEEFTPYDPAADDDVDLVWPSSLVCPNPSVALVYLDLNHWIGLAQAMTGHPQGGRYEEALAACRRARAADTVMFPLSGSLYMEIAKIVDPNRRANLASVIEELSGFETLVARSVVMHLELETVLNDLPGATPIMIPHITLLGFGIHHATGMNGELKIKNLDGLDVTSKVREDTGPANFDSMMASMRLDLERQMLRGPRDAEEEAALRANGWLPDAAVRIAEDRAQAELGLAEILSKDERWRKGRLRDVLAANEIERELLDPLIVALPQRSLRFQGLFSDRESIRHFARSMPSFEVSIEMKTQYHRNVFSKWDSNTIFDIDAMSIAAPYCNAVVTEKHAAQALTRARLPERLTTAIMSSPEELVEYLSKEARA